jgi:hypothetical protein
MNVLLVDKVTNQIFDWIRMCSRKINSSMTTDAHIWTLCEKKCLWPKISAAAARTEIFLVVKLIFLRCLYFLLIALLKELLQKKNLLYLMQ